MYKKGKESKESGAQGRKRRRQEEHEMAKSSELLANYFVKKVADDDEEPQDEIHDEEQRQHEDVDTEDIGSINEALRSDANDEPVDESQTQSIEQTKSDDSTTAQDASDKFTDKYY